MIVIGSGFGDEGKGLVTSFLCSQTEKPLVVRFNGGHQAGHTVVYEGKRHVFSSFGSGTLQNVPTYWSSYCTFYPPAFLNEWKLLNNPLIYVNPLAPVTTPFDIDHNRNNNRHGSVGVGFGSTLARQENYYKLFVQDLFYESVLITKLRAIGTYYGANHIEECIEYFLNFIDEVKDMIIVSDDKIMRGFDPIFEGAQGILLDMDFGFFPNVTRSNTTTKNALQIYSSKEVYYVTRSYLTRHGDGYLPDEKELKLSNNENETNRLNYQGRFRTAELSIPLLNYALQCDNHYSQGLKKNLIITCMDQFEIDIEGLLKKLWVDFDAVYVSNGDQLTNISLYKKQKVYG